MSRIRMKDKKSTNNILTSTSKTEETRKNTEVLIFAVLLALIIISSVMILRIMQNKPVLASGESYYNLRIAQELKQTLFITQDPVQGTTYNPNPYHYLLALLLKVLPLEIVSLFLPLALGICSALLFFRLLITLGVKHPQAAYSLVILSATPAFIILFTGLYLSGFILFLSLLTIFLVINNRKSQYVLVICTLLFLIMALTSLTGFLITIIALFLICLALRRKPRIIAIPVIITAIIIAALTLFLGYVSKLQGFHSFDFKNVLSVLGAGMGFDIFLLLLFITGFIIIWARNKEKRLLHLTILLFVIISFLNAIARAFSSFIITFYCVIAITYFYNRKWDLSIIRTGTLLLVLCSLVFSATNQINIIIKSPPDQNIINALSLLKELDNGVVLTSEDNGFLVELYSNKKVMLDSNSFLLPSYQDYQSNYNALWITARLKDAEPLLDHYKIKYILITPEMKEEFWEGREQGLWFLVRNSESFIKKYENAGIELWEYIAPAAISPPAPPPAPPPVPPSEPVLGNANATAAIA